MPDFAAYIEHLGLPASEAETLKGRIGSWSELHRWMDENCLSQIRPRLQRVSIVPRALNLSLKASVARLFRRQGDAPAAAQNAPLRGWAALVEHRRRVKLALTLSTTALLLLVSAQLLLAEQMPAAALDMYLAIYGVMTYFMASNSYKLFLGTWHTRHGTGSNPWHPSKQARDPAPGVKVAIVYPVLHEDVARVAAGIAATWNSIACGFPQFAGHFDLFLLSDSRQAEYWIAEEAAVHELRSAFPAGRFFYRRRSIRANAKLGNIMDFCRRWGRRYDYMLMMDADSVMDGAACVALLRMMEGTAELGILQTNPRPVLRRSLFGRMQQFSGRLYGSVFSYSLQSMYMGHAFYIGHNAIIRLKPFIDHCILPRLSGNAPWGGKPLSHDIVEAALMARAGYEVWFLPEIEGSYEETPANILNFLIRERRWMQGNLQHLRFLFLNGLRTVHRENFLNGTMGYVSAPLWTGFLAVSAYGTVHFLQDGMIAPQSFGAIELPAIMLATAALVFLFLPRLLAFFMHIRSDKARMFGGKDKLAWSMLIEMAFSFFFSPIVMIYLTRFMWLWLKRRSISWGKSQRSDETVPWAACFRHFGWVSVVGLACCVALVLALQGVSTQRDLLIGMASGGWITPAAVLIGFFPIIGGFTGSALIVRFTSRSFPSVRGCRLFCIPEEVEVPAVLQDMLGWERRLATRLPCLHDSAQAMAYAVGNPGFYVRHRPETRPRAHVAQALLPKIRSRSVLSDEEVRLALAERRCFDALHVALQEDGIP